MEFEGKSYFPSLFLRNAEMTALKESANAVKDAIIPTLFLRPWATTKKLVSSINKIHDVFGDRKYFLDLDRYYSANNDERGAVSDFLNLRQKSSMVEWFSFVKDIESAIPTIRTAGFTVAEMREQIRICTEIDRGFLIRIDREAGTNVNDVVLVSSEIEHANYVFSVDPGWSRDLLSHVLWASNTVRSISQIRPEIPVIISGSSFPDTFQTSGHEGTIEIKEKFLYSEVVRNNNNVNCLYGDWASVRPPVADSKPMKIVPRIDVASAGRWKYFRYQNDDGGYQAAALDAMDDPSWDDGLNIYGTYLIRATADGDSSEITYPGAATAARVNMHLHMQAASSGGSQTLPTEDDFID